MKNKYTHLAPLVALGALAAPLVAAAQTGINVPYIKGYADNITSVVNLVLVPVLFAIAFLVFLWGVYLYFIQGSADEAKRATGRQVTLWGVIAFVVIVALWGIVNIVMSATGLTATQSPTPPTIGPTPTTSNTTGRPTLPSGTPVGGSSGASSGGTTGTSCTGSGQSTCANGYTCEVTGEGRNTCQIAGCNDPAADNYNSSATINNGACTYNNAGAGL